jgi:hypothetical protein
VEALVSAQVTCNHKTRMARLTDGTPLAFRFAVLMMRNSPGQVPDEPIRDEPDEPVEPDHIPDTPPSEPPPIPIKDPRPDTSPPGPLIARAT